MCQTYRITGKLRSEEMWKISNPTSYWDQEQLRDQTRLLSNNKGCTAFVGNPARLSSWWNFSLHPYEPLNSCLLPLILQPCTTVKSLAPSAWQVSPRHRVLLLGSPIPALLQAEPAQVPQPILVALHWPHLSNPSPFNCMSYKEHPNHYKARTTAHSTMLLIESAWKSILFTTDSE